MLSSLSNTSVNESVRRKFEAGWREGPRLPIERVLPPLDDPLYRATLEELIHIELEMSWRDSRSGPRVEHYLERFPALNEPSTVARLAQQEYLVRHLFADRPTSQEYQERFPGLELTLPYVPGARVTIEEPTSVTGYEILGQLGRGGMGVVFKARQTKLNRLVALKWIRSGEASEQELARFRMEAEAAARLRHPNIVQVYEVGEHQGRPFLSMEYLDGGSLSERLAGSPLPPRLAASAVAILARAIHYAHEQGILHRDLKPANILLEREEGSLKDENNNPVYSSLLPISAPLRPKIADFGLAKQMSGDSGQTNTGVVLGTPGYMSPEQAKGDRNLGPATDVWALGAILYECLTGRQPFQGETGWDTIQQVLNSEPAPPTRLQSSTPLDLETIALKCLEKSPERRFASAAALAEDLERFLRDEPILARPIGNVERGWRWARRNPRVAGLLTALFAVLTAGLAATSTLYFLAESRRKSAETAQERADREKIAADESSRQARAAVRESLTLAAEDPAFQKDGMAPARRKLQEAGLKYFREFIAQRGDDAALVEEVADAHERVARLSSQLGTQEAAIAEFEKAKSLYTRLTEQNPAEPKHRVQLANVLGEIGLRKGNIGKMDDAKTLFAEATSLLNPLVESEPNNLKYRLHLADTELSTGITLLKAQRWKEAVVELDRARNRFPIVLSSSAPLIARRNQATTLTMLSQAHWHLRELAKAEEFILQAIPLHEGLLKTNPSPFYRRELAIDYGSHGLILAERGQKEAYRDAYRKSVQLREQSADLNPTGHDFQTDAAIGCIELAHAEEGMKNPDDAEVLRLRQKALAYTQKAVAGDATVVESWKRLGESHWNLLLYYRKAKQLDFVETHLQEAAVAWDKVVALAPNVPDHKELPALAHFQRASMLRDAKRYEEAIERYLVSRRLREEIQKARPANLKNIQEITRIDVNLAYIQQETGKLEECVKTYISVLTRRRETLATQPQNRGFQQDLNNARLNAALTAEGIVDRVLKSVAKAERFDAILAGKLLAELDKADPNPDVQKQIQRLASGAP